MNNSSAASEAMKEPTKEEMKAKKKKLTADRTKSIKQIVAFCGDGMVASHVVTLPEKLGLWEGGFSDLTVGLSGMTSSLIQSHNLWPA